tara:strand:+ start:518 stop:769 length:252 start_codon:yes stop_codon:yes gene_type:complete
MNPDQNEEMMNEQVVGVVMGDITHRANAALKYLDWLEGVTGPRWIGTERGAVKQDGRKPFEAEIETRKAALHYLRLHFLGEMD